MGNKGEIIVINDYSLAGGGKSSLKKCLSIDQPFQLLGKIIDL